jgi:hypothetical protein
MTPIHEKQGRTATTHQLCVFSFLRSTGPRRRPQVPWAASSCCCSPERGCPAQLSLASATVQDRVLTFIGDVVLCSRDSEVLLAVAAHLLLGFLVQVPQQDVPGLRGYHCNSRARFSPQ